MQAIVTKYLAPTNYRDTRIVATTAAGKRVVSWNHELDVEENHRAAAQALKTSLDWDHPNYGTLIGGQMANGDYCWVMTGRMR